MRPSGNVRDFIQISTFLCIGVIKIYATQNLCQWYLTRIKKKIVHLTAIKFNVAHLLKCLCQPVSSFMASLNLGLVVDSYIESLMLNLKVKPV